MKGKTINELVLGDQASFRKKITESDVYTFAEISGDNNPAHVDEEYAKNSVFKERIAHGILTAGLISAVIGMELPGPGSIYLSQELRFTAPVRFNDTIEAVVEVIEINKEKNRVTLSTRCFNQDEELVLKGKALVMPPK